jgi:hypothetical protein
VRTYFARIRFIEVGEEPFGDMDLLLLMKEMNHEQKKSNALIEREKK